MTPSSEARMAPNNAACGTLALHANNTDPTHHPLIVIIITLPLSQHPTYRGIVLVQRIQKRSQFPWVDAMTPLRVSATPTPSTTAAFPLQHSGRVVIVLHFLHAGVLLPASPSAHDLGAALLLPLWLCGVVRCGVGSEGLVDGAA